MAQSSQDILQRIEALLRTGRQQESRLLLLEDIKSNPSSAEGWWLLSQVVSDPDQQTDCLERVLLLDPENAPALERLASLKDRAGGPPVASPALYDEEPEPPSSVMPYSFSSQDNDPKPSPPAALSSSTEEKPASISHEKAQKKFHWAELFLASVLIVVFIIGAFFLWNRRLSQIAAENANRLEQTRAIALILTQLPTSTASSTPIITLTPTITTVASLTPTLDKRYTFTPPPTDQFRPAAGYYAPSFDLRDAKSVQWISLKQYAGGPVLLYFCDTTSTTCQDELNIMKAVQQKYAGQELVILFVISGENSPAVELYQKAEQLTYPVLVDLDDLAKNLYQVQSIPAFYFIDSIGKIVSIETGLISYPELVKQIGNILP